MKTGIDFVRGNASAAELGVTAAGAALGLVSVGGGLGKAARLGLGDEVGSGVSFIVNTAGEAVPIPRGAIGPVAPQRGLGMSFQGGSGGFGMDARVTGVRIVDGNANAGRRVNYMNISGQSVNPLTGRTVSKSDPSIHIPYKQP